MWELTCSFCGFHARNHEVMFEGMDGVHICTWCVGDSVALIERSYGKREHLGIFNKLEIFFCGDRVARENRKARRGRNQECSTWFATNARRTIVQSSILVAVSTANTCAVIALRWLSKLANRVWSAL